MLKTGVVLSALLLLIVGEAKAAPDLDPQHIVGDLCTTLGDPAPQTTHVYHLRNGGEVVFIAVSHVVDTRSAAKTAAILKGITDAFDRYRPDIVLVEAASAAKSDDSHYLQFLVDTANRRFAAGGIEENLFAVKIASDRNVKFAGWDMSPHDEYVADIADGFAVADAIGAHLLRARQNPFASPSAPLIHSEVSAVPRVDQPTSFDFTGWYHATYGDSFDPRAGTPCGSGIASRIVKNESIRRTLNLAHLLVSDAQPGKIVLVEGGSAHWAALHLYLQSLSTPASAGSGPLARR
jgi:hypothetical protein